MKAYTERVFGNHEARMSWPIALRLTVATSLRL